MTQCLVTMFCGGSHTTIITRVQKYLKHFHYYINIPGAKKLLFYLGLVCLQIR